MVITVQFMTAVAKQNSRLERQLRRYVYYMTHSYWSSNGTAATTGTASTKGSHEGMHAANALLWAQKMQAYRRLRPFAFHILEFHRIGPDTYYLVIRKSQLMIIIVCNNLLPIFCFSFTILDNCIYWCGFYVHGEE